MYLKKPLKPSNTNDFFIIEMFCTECLEDTLMRRVLESRTIPFIKEGLELIVTLEALQCLCCSAFRLSKEVNERNFERIYEALIDARTKRMLDKTYKRAEE